jgi:negative regulator of sigma-B (phosphoserine phosphatase)
VKIAAEHLTLPKQGETASGDAALFRRDGDAALFAVVDALGHGVHAAEVAQAGMQFLQEAPIPKGAIALMEGLHRRLQGTRGAAAMVCTWMSGRLEGCGVGNVELSALNVKIPIMLTHGIVGARIRALRGFHGAAGAGCRFVLYSDGISTAIAREDLRTLPRAAACRAMMEKHRKPHDDATIMIVDLEADT